MFRLLWRNRERARLEPMRLHPHRQPAAVRPGLPEDGFQIRETVVECMQYLKLTAAELARLPARPCRDGMPDDQEIVFHGGSTLILDEYGDLKFEVDNPMPAGRVSLDRRRRWQRRLDYLWDNGFLTRARSADQGPLRRSTANARGPRSAPAGGRRRPSHRPRGWT